jgi:hypothetical protein
LTGETSDETARTETGSCPVRLDKLRLVLPAQRQRALNAGRDTNGKPGALCFESRTHAMTKWRNFPNLSLRPARPSFNRGPVQRRAKRALLVLGTASTSTITQWTHRRPTPGITRSTRRALEQIGAVRVGRAATTGKPWLWRLRNSHEDTR